MYRLIIVFILYCHYMALPSNLLDLQPGMSFRACITSGLPMEGNKFVYH